MVGSGFYAGIFCMCLATERFLQGRTADVINTDGEKLDPGESTDEFCVEMRHHVLHEFTLKLQTAPLTQNRIMMRQVIKNIYSRKRSGNKTNKKRLWNLCTLSDILPSYNLILRALLIGLFRSHQVQIPLEITSSTEAEPTLTPSAARETMPSHKYQLTERD